MILWIIIVFSSGIDSDTAPRPTDIEAAEGTGEASDDQKTKETSSGEKMTSSSGTKMEPQQFNAWLNLFSELDPIAQSKSGNVAWAVNYMVYIVHCIHCTLHGLHCTLNTLITSIDTASIRRLFKISNWCDFCYIYINPRDGICALLEECTNSMSSPIACTSLIRMFIEAHCWKTVISSQSGFDCWSFVLRNNYTAVIIVCCINKNVFLVFFVAPGCTHTFGNYMIIIISRYR